jgi:beta-xylosidase
MDAQQRSEAWHDPRRTPADRADALVRVMSLEEKAAQLVGLWVGADASGGGVAPFQAELGGDAPAWPDAIRHGLGQLTRPFGTAPVEPAQGARSLAASQAEIVAASRFGIPALVHEECLTGFATWRATAYPAPLSWGATFDPGLVREMAALIGTGMRAVGVHQGLAPVLDVTRDYRWGRTEETIGEDPHLVGTIGTAYVQGLQSAGIVATLKHFVGYSASRGARNLAPVSMGPRELAETLLPPFEMALRLGGARSVMPSYAEIDGLPVAADRQLLTELLRQEWGFRGTVVSDYFSVRFLESLHGVAGTAGQAAGIALAAGIDVELPTVDTFGPPLLEAVRAGDVDEALVDRAVRAVLTQKAELGLLDPGWSPLPDDVDSVCLDDERGRDVALRLAREAVVLLQNDEVLPLAPGRRIALIGPVADDPMAMLGCYSFPAHVGVRHPDHELGLDLPSLREALARRVPGLRYARGCGIDDGDPSGIDAAAALAADADVCVLAVGDRAGLFGRGTSGEGCDATDLSLPGVQPELVRAVLATCTPVVLVLLTGRPYALPDDVRGAAAIVQAFFPGQSGGRAVAEVLTGAVNPSGRLPVGVPRDAGGSPGSYLAPPLGLRSGVSSVDPTPAFPFGHGLGYTTFDWTDPTVVADAVLVAGADVPDGAVDVDPEGPVPWAIDGEATVQVTVTNTGDRPGTEVVQLYLHDPVARTTRPVVRLIGYLRVPLDPGASTRVTFAVPADLTSFIGVHGRRVVEPGDVELRLARSSRDVAAALRLRLVGPERETGADRRLLPVTGVERLDPLVAQEARG